MYYFHIQFANGDIYLVQVERCDGDTVNSATREARKIVNKYRDGKYTIREATLEDVVEVLTFTNNIALLY